MKKEYICPDTMALEAMADEYLLAGSGVNSGGADDTYKIDYGGTDPEGDLEPAVRAIVNTFFVTDL